VSAGKFEDHLARVEKIMEELESGNLDLEESIGKYETGISSLKKCYEILGQMEKRIEILIKDENGNFVTKPFKVKKTQETEQS
ncbi:MAG: exodeoxyribonuclease VII small subunit, partial [Planctomycetota bacterium]